MARPEAFGIACSHTLLVSSSYVSLAHSAQTHEYLIVSQRSNPLLRNQKQARIILGSRSLHALPRRENDMENF